MATQVSGVLLIGAFAAAAAAGIIGVPGLYAARDIDDQLELIAAHRRRWLATQVSVSIYVLLATGGFLALAVDLGSSSSVWLPVAAAVAVVAGSASGLYFVYLQTIDPRGGYSGRYPIPEVAAYWLWLAGVLLFGLALLGSGPVWLGFVAAGGALVFAGFYLVSGMGFLTPMLTVLIGLVIGIERLLS